MGEDAPVFALLLGTLFLGITTDVGFAGTSKAVMSGFADVLGDIGVLITSGVIMGALLTATDTMQRLVTAMLRIFGERSLPYVIGVALSSLFTSICSGVLPSCRPRSPASSACASVPAASLSWAAR